MRKRNFKFTKKSVSALVVLGILVVIVTNFFIRLAINKKEEKLAAAEPVYEEKYGDTTIAVCGYYLINSDGKIFDTRNYEGRFKYPIARYPIVYTDYFQTKALVRDANGVLCMYDSDLNYVPIAYKVGDVGMSLSGNRLFYIQGPNYDLYVLDAESGEIIRRLYNVLYATISPNGKYLLYRPYSENRIHSMNLDTGKITSLGSTRIGHLYKPLAISDDGQTAYVYDYKDHTLANKNSYEVVCIHDGVSETVGAEGTTNSYSNWVLGKGHSDIVGYNRGKYGYFCSSNSSNASYPMESATVLFSSDYTLMEHNGDMNIVCLNQTKSGGYVVTKKETYKYILEDGVEVSLFTSHHKYLFSGYDDGVFTAYSIEGNRVERTYVDVTDVRNADGKYYKAAGVRFEEFLPEYKVITMKTNESRNRFYFLTTDFEVYCYDGNNNEIKLISTVEKMDVKSGEFRHSEWIVYSQFDDKLYYRDGNTLYCYDPYTEEITLVADTCLAIYGGDHKTDLVRYYKESMDDEMYLIDGKIFVPEE